jgi:hypothetical protein
VAIDQDLFFSRRLGLGLRPGETLGATPREWAMEQLRSIPPLDFFDKSGNSILSTLPPYAKPFENYDQSLRNFEKKWTLQKKLFADGKNRSPETLINRCSSR